MPNHWLLKTEPSTYSFDQLAKDGSAVWDGVRNNLALAHLRKMKEGDRLFDLPLRCREGGDRTAKVAGAAYPDPARVIPRSWSWTWCRRAGWPSPVTLAAIKAEASLAEMPLVRMPRLSVMPVTAEQWKRIIAMGAGK